MGQILSWFHVSTSSPSIDAGSCLATLACLSSTLMMLYWKRHTTRLPLPPGPKPLPIIGNLFDIPSGKSWIKLSQWARRYGDIVHISFFGQHIIFLNSVKAANDLLERRAAVYSDRPHIPLLSELMGLDWNFGLMPYGDEWRMHRRSLVGRFGPSQVHIFDPVQEFVGCLLVERLLENKYDLEAQCKLHAGQSILMAIYGILVNSPEHEYISNAEAIMNAVGEFLGPLGILVDVLPILKSIPEWVPGAFYQRIAKDWAGYMRKLKDSPFESSRENFMDGKSPYPSYVGNFFKSCDGGSTQELEYVVSGSGAVAYGAGSDTSYSAIFAFFLAMTMYPEVQRKAQQELDLVVGTQRLPQMSDRKSLPYINAVAKEVLRWHSAAPLSVPHLVREEDSYKGYRIPAGSMVVSNTWWMAHDPAVYHEPEQFKPERFINANCELEINGIDPARHVFGFGRRICPGMHYAENSLFISIATVLAVLKIEPQKDANGKPMQVKLDPSPGILSHPAPYPCRVTARSEKAVDLLLAARAGMLL